MQDGSTVPTGTPTADEAQAASVIDKAREESQVTTQPVEEPTADPKPALAKTSSGKKSSPKRSKPKTKSNTGAGWKNLAHLPDGGDRAKLPRSGKSRLCADKMLTKTGLTAEFHHDQYPYSKPLSGAVMWVRKRALDLRLEGSDQHFPQVREDKAGTVVAVRVTTKEEYEAAA